MEEDNPPGFCEDLMTNIDPPNNKPCYRRFLLLN